MDYAYREINDAFLFLLTTQKKLPNLIKKTGISRDGRTGDKSLQLYRRHPERIIKKEIR
jgi:hypothetical protein